MAKGLGAIMAQAAMAQEQARLEKFKAVACPFCGRETEADVTWFCYGGPPHKVKCEKLLALEDVFGCAWDAQGQVVAAVVDSGQLLIEARIVRGGGGLSNLSISAVDRRNKDSVPALIARYGWTFLDETHHLRENTSNEN